jgi:catechol 2,3-dioxygenase-like lactoylglutathione lyase family enzyme
VFLGLRTVIYPAPDLQAAKSWFTALLGQDPYFDQPFYVGYEVGGYELGLDPDGQVADGARTYWGVADADAAIQWLLSHGAAERRAVQEVGDGIRVATVESPAGSLIGIIENPHFQAYGAGPQAGPGR